MTLVWGRVRKPFVSENMPEMTAAGAASYFRAASVLVGVFSHSPCDVCPEPWPAAPTVEFHRTSVKWGFACSAKVSASLEMVVESALGLSDTSRLCSFQPHNLELRVSKDFGPMLVTEVVVAAL